MFKFLFIVFTILFLAVSFIIHAQSVKMNQVGPKIDFLATKKGTLSVQTSSGSGANGAPGNAITSFTASPHTYLCQNNSPDSISCSFYLSSNYTFWYYNGILISPDSVISLGSGQQEIIARLPGIYRVVVAWDNNVADSIMWQEVSITSTLPVIIPSNTTVCSGSSVVLNAPTIDSADGVYVMINSFQWYNGSALLTNQTSSQYSASQTGSYYVQTTDANGCIMNSDIVDVSVDTLSKLLLISGSDCPNGKLIIDTDSSTALIPDSITWYRNDTVINKFNNTGTTVAGGNSSGNGLNQLNNPYGIFLDSAKNIYIADYGNNRIVKWAPNASSGTVIMDSVSYLINGGLPNDIFVDAQQNLSVSTSLGIIATPLPFHNIIKKYIGEPGTFSFSGDNNLNLYICNGVNDSVEQWNPYQNTYSNFFASTIFNHYIPDDIFIDTIHSIFYMIVTDLDTVDKYFNWPAYVLEWTSTTSPQIVAGGFDSSGISLIGGAGYLSLTVDKKGDIYLGDADQQKVQIWTPGATSGILLDGPTNNGMRPEGVELDSNDNLYVSDNLNNQVLKFSADSLQSLIADSISNIQGTIVAGGNGRGQNLSELNSPFGIFVDANKNIYIADADNYRIVEWAAGATTGQIILDSIQNFDGIQGTPPNYIWIDKNQNMFLSDAGYVIIVPLPVTFKLKAANSWGITGDADSNLYIAENGGVEKWNPYTNADSLFGKSSVNQPNGICLDPAQNIYVGDNLTDPELNYYGRILKFNSESASAISSIGTNYSQIGAVGGIAVDSAGNMFIADINNNRVLVWEKNAAEPTTMASGYTPWGIKLDSDGNIYVADQTNNRVVMYPPMIKNFITDTPVGVYKAQVTYPGGCTQPTDSITVIECRALRFQLVNFTGQLQTNNVLLNWQTAQEINTSSFEIERSADKNNFSSIGNLNASGNSSTTKNYSFIDQQPLQGANYYRLKMIDSDGIFTYSNIVVVNYNTSTNLFKIFPNPANNILNVMIYGTNENATLQIMDMTGRKIREQQINLNGNTFFSIDISNLAKGTYNLLLKSGSMNEQKKFVKE